ncbi:imidazolonepropionase [Niabella ginsenosidivorans]|uniref:Imidazolonepropionase n=1 Tax=Niabella ginsenosidivorans TaxID=1176587 RepID=A0A1A9HYP0_9BACT|nr:imidazolonepropionase [Niabella ginsenosidivorans]ANH80205.1 imidazolonepropionase [Niabella ginsenosidivorans]
MNTKQPYRLLGPFKEIVTMEGLPLKGALKDEQLRVIKNGGILLNGDIIEAVDSFEKLALLNSAVVGPVVNSVVLPGFVDMHTHIAFGGSRANDFALRNSGSHYLEIAEKGGGIWSTVEATRELSLLQLAAVTAQRAAELLQQGITTIEVKSGYGLNVEQELKTLRAIRDAQQLAKADLVATCLAAHILPKDFNGSHQAYLQWIIHELLPLIREEQLATRVDAFVEKGAFAAEDILPYYQKAKAMGFDITVHADQFTPSGSAVAAQAGALSADHLESSTQKEIDRLAKSGVIATALPGASMGLGCAFAPARKLLDAGNAVTIATDWNPGSAPMGCLMTQASVLACYERLTNAEVLAAITFRAAAGLGLKDRGILARGYLADFVIYATDSYKEITYQQGRLQPLAVWKKGVSVYTAK